MEPFIGQIILVGGDFAPAGWLECNGELLAKDENISLFTLLGTKFGGDGEKTFALPKMTPPAKGLKYVIAIRGVYPPRR